MRSTEDQNAARIDRHFLAGLGIASHALALAPHRETAEGGDLHHVAAGKRARDLVEHGLHQLRRFVAREANLLVDRLAQLRARYRLPRHRIFPPRRGTLNPAGKCVNYRRLDAEAYLANRCPRSTRGYQRTSAAPQVIPPPMA